LDVPEAGVKWVLDVFNPTTGRFHRFATGSVAIEGLWGTALGNGGRAGDPDALYFKAGPAGESHGLFGSLSPAMKHGLGMDDDEDDE
jgi:hypothetical protein